MAAPQSEAPNPYQPPQAELLAPAQHRPLDWLGVAIAAVPCGVLALACFYGALTGNPPTAEFQAIYGVVFLIVCVGMSLLAIAFHRGRVRHD